MLRKLFSKLSNSFNQSAVSPRQSFNVPVRIWLEPLKTTGRLEIPGKSGIVYGETCNLSESGIAFIVSSIRVEENYLVGDGRVLNAEIELPECRISMQVMGRRYEPADSSLGLGKYLIGASIERMSDDHRKIYERFLRQGIRRLKRGSSIIAAEKV